MAAVAVLCQRAAGVAGLVLRRALAMSAPVAAIAADARFWVPSRLARVQSHSTAAAAAAVPVPVTMKDGHVTLPAAVAMSFALLPPGHPAAAALATVTSLDLSDNSKVTDAVIARLPSTLRVLNVSKCKRLTRDVSFAHLTALESLNCWNTKAVDAGLACLPPSLQRLDMACCKLPDTADFSHLIALRVTELTAAGRAVLDSLPPCLEELTISLLASATSLAHLTQLRNLRTTFSNIDDATLAMLPPTLEELSIEHCKLSPAASFARFTRLRILGAEDSNLGDAVLATLPPSLESLDLANRYGSKPPALTAAAVFSHLPTLRVLNVNYTDIGDASIASMPAGLEKLHMVRCRSVTQRASLDHLAALRKLDGYETDLSRATFAACRARGCDAPADGIVTTNTDSSSLAVLPDGRLVNNPSGKDVALWDPVRGNALVGKLHIKGDLDVSALAALPDSRHVAVGVTYKLRGPGGLYVWDTGVTPHTVDTTAIATIAAIGSVDAMVVLPGGSLVAGGSIGLLFVVDTGRRVVVAMLKGHTDSITALAVLPDGCLASASKDGDVRLWDIATRTCVGVLRRHKGGATALLALPDGRLASGAGDGTVRLWDVGRRARVGKVFRVYCRVCALGVLADNRLAAVSEAGYINVWDLRSAHCQSWGKQVG